MKFDHIFKPRNAIEIRQVKAIETAASILEEHFNLQQMGLTLQAQRQSGWGRHDAFHAGMYCPADRLIKINFRNLSGVPLNYIIAVLGHEFRHAIQYHTKLLSNPYSRAWSGDIYPKVIGEGCGSWMNRYLSYPWEIDARLHQKEYAQIVFNHPKFIPFMEFIDEFTGELLYKEDRAQTVLTIPYEPSGLNFFRMRKDSDELYWLHISQIPKAKKWTKSIVDKAFTEFRDIMTSQPVKRVMVPVTIDDLVS